MNNFYRLSGLFVALILAVLLLFNPFLHDMKEDLNIVEKQIKGLALIQEIQSATMKTEAYLILLQFQNSRYFSEIASEFKIVKDDLDQSLKRLQDLVLKHKEYQSQELSQTIDGLQSLVRDKKNLSLQDLSRVDSYLKYLREESFTAGDISTLHYEGEKDLYLFASIMTHYIPEFTGELSTTRSLLTEGLLAKNFSIQRRNKIVHSLSLFFLSKEEIEQIVKMISAQYDSGDLEALLQKTDLNISYIKDISDDIAKDKEVILDPFEFYRATDKISKLSIEIYNENSRLLSKTLELRKASLSDKVLYSNLLLGFITLLGLIAVTLVSFFTISTLVNEKRVNNLLNQAQDAVDAFTLVCKMDTEGKIIYVNDKFCEVSGYKYEEVVGQSYETVRHTDMEADFFEKMWETIQNREPWTGKVKNKAKDGEMFYLDMLIKPILDEEYNIVEYIAISSDITELELIKEKLEMELNTTHESLYEAYVLANEQKKLLEEQKELYELVFKNTASSVLIIDIEANKFIECNEQAIEILGCASKFEVLNLRPADVSPVFQPDGRRSDEKSVEMNKVAIEKGSHSFEWKHLRKTGEEFWVEVVLTPILLANKKVLHVVWKDIEEKKQAEIEKEEQKLLMIQQSRFASMGEMIGNISHQWRQPLNALGLLLQKLSLYQSRGLLDEEKLHSSVDKGMNLINSMSSTIDDFRDFFNPKKEKTLFSIKEAIEKAYTIVESSFEQASIDFTLDMDDDKIGIEGYENEFSQVIVNLLNNAKDVLIEKQVSSANVTVRVSRDKNEINISVYDNGGGIPSSVAEKIFDPYFTTKEEGKGTGIGLYMSKMIIEDHMNGTFSFYNTDEGACFSIELMSNHPR